MLKTGNKIGLLTLIKKEKRSDKKWYWLCKCKCGNEKWIRADALTKKNPTKSCGCLSKKTQIKALELTNKKFGKLTVIKATNQKSSNSVVWKCKCDCGNIAYVSAVNLNNGNTKSCGCNKTLQRENMRKSGYKKLKETNFIDGTSIMHITSKKLFKNNTSGVRGVTWNKDRNKWVAQIVFKGKNYYLGRYDNKDDAINIRKYAEEKLFDEFIKWYEEKYKKK